ncbi:MAG: hypothetical protein H8D45_26230 [Bacteroidetes bacterium]|nr:hypothetical protein [Bacteroidota bacterium]
MLNQLEDLYDTAIGIDMSPEAIDFGKPFTKAKLQVGNADIIIPYFGSYDNRSIFRLLLSSSFTKIVNFISGFKISYYNGPVMHLRYNVMRWSPDTYGFAYQAELITSVLIEGGSYQEVQIVNTDRDAGISKAFSLKNILSIIHSLLQILLRKLRQFLFYRK